MNPYKYTESVSVELSNLCNLATIHTKCPLHTQGPTLTNDVEPVMLNTSTITTVIDDLAKYQYQGTFLPSCYNEPLIDPRLHLIVDYAHEAIPDMPIYIWTNGMFLTRAFAIELHECGVSSFIISPYSPTMRTRFLERFCNLPYIKIKSGTLDDRLDIYTQPILHTDVPCGAPLRQIVITCHGDVSLCCYDWKRTKTFGSLFEMSLSKIVRQPSMLHWYRRMQTGLRDIAPCCHCRRKH